MKFLDDAEALIAIVLLLAIAVAGYVVYRKLNPNGDAIGALVNGDPIQSLIDLMPQGALVDVPGFFRAMGDPPVPSVYTGDWPNLSNNPAAGAGLGLGGGGGDAF